MERGGLISLRLGIDFASRFASSETRSPAIRWISARHGEFGTSLSAVSARRSILRPHRVDDRRVAERIGPLTKLGRRVGRRYGDTLGESIQLLVTRLKRGSPDLSEKVARQSAKIGGPDRRPGSYSDFDGRIFVLDIEKLRDQSEQLGFVVGLAHEPIGAGGAHLGLLGQQNTRRDG